MILSLAALATGGYLAVTAGMYAFQRNLLYLPSSTLPSPAASGVSEMAPVSLTTADGLDLTSWYRPALGSKATIVYFHGNGGHLGFRAFKVRPYLDAGFGVLLVEYRGYGGNPGKPSEEGLYQDGRAAMAFLTARGVGADVAVLYGESLGSAVAIQIAAEQAKSGRQVSAVVLEAPPSSIVEVGSHHYPWLPVRWLLKDRFESNAKISDIAAPLLIVHGEADQVVPIRFGRALFDAAAEPKQGIWIAGASHENLDEFDAHLSIIEFLGRTVKKTP